ncbi:glycosyltransferase family 4 protein [Microbacterium lacus]|uniref:glycosyltransferase family 4 protein n=1 Tax=Microbacterium lacus TaxID=415217 RepID=UPI00384EA279
MTALRILHVVRSDRFAGVEQFVRRLAIAQAAAGHTVWVAGGSEADMRGTLQQSGVRYRPAARAGEVAHAVRKLGSGADVINAHMTAADVEAVIAATGLRRRPALVATRHFTRQRGSRAPGSLFRAVERRLDAELSISDAVAAAINVPSTVVYSGVETPPRPPAADRVPIVLMAQRLQPEKRTDVGIRAFAESGLAAHGWMLQIAGDGPERPQLEGLAAQLGVGSATQFLGFRNDVSELMARAGMLLAPCPVEGLGLSVLEAMALALPVVAADAGGHSSLLADLDERALFWPDDAGHAAAQLHALGHDADGRDTLGIAERERQSERFSIETWRAGTDAVYRRAIAIRAGASGQ